MAKLNGSINGWMKILSGIILLAITAFSSAFVTVKVLERDVEMTTTDIQDIQVRLRECENKIGQNEVGVQKDIAYIKEHLDKIHGELKAFRTQTIEYLSTSNH